MLPQNIPSLPPWLMLLVSLPNPDVALGYAKLAQRGIRILHDKAKELGNQHRKALSPAPIPIIWRDHDEEINEQA